MRNADRWMFGYGSPVALGLFRAVFASIVFVSLAMTAIDFEAWYTESGYVPVANLETWAGGFSFFSPLSHVVDPRTTAVVYGLTMLAALTTAFGLWSRASSIALLVGVVSLHHRSPLILHSGDTLARAMLLFIALAPSGRACSLDRLFALRKGETDLIKPVSLWPQRMMQVQMATLYIATVWHKSLGATWMDGTATHYPLNLNEFARFAAPSWLDAQPVLAVTTWGTLVIELAMGTLVFSKPLRRTVLTCGLALHAGIEVLFNIPIFAFFVTSCYIVFYEGEEVERWLAMVGDRMRRPKLARMGAGGVR